MLFALPCKVNGQKAKYIFAVTTDEEYRGKGYASELLEQLKSFPLGAHDDIIDALSYGYLELKDKKDPTGLYSTSKKRHGRRRR